MTSARAGGGERPARKRRGGPASPQDLWRGIERAAGGALIFGLPLLMTTELWSLGLTLDRWRVAQLTVLSLPLLVGVAHYLGFEATFGWREDVRDALLALGIGVATSAALLGLFGVLEVGVRGAGLTGQVALQATPAAFGALLARSQFGDAGRDEPPGTAGELFHMVVGALFLCLSVAPTEEILMIAARLSPERAALLVLVSLAVMHGFARVGAGEGGRAWFGLTLIGYVVTLGVCLYVLWTFGQIAGLAPHTVLAATVVLGLPAAVGAGAARLIL
jgi:putative integral membrane protein (TIGR02587 family)